MFVPKIAINFCGGCNSAIDRGAIAKEIRETLEYYGATVLFNDYDVDFIIFLSGCSVGCVDRENPVDVPFLAIAGEIFDRRSMPEEELAERASELVMRRFDLRKERKIG